MTSEEMAQQLDRRISELNRFGTEWSRQNIEKIKEEKESLLKQLLKMQEWSKYHEEDNKSDIMTMKTAQKIFTENIFPEMKKTVEAGKKFAVQSAEDAALSVKAVNKMEDDTKNYRNWTFGIFIVIMSGVLGMIYTGFAKLNQADKHQEQLVQYLSAMTNRLDQAPVTASKVKELNPPATQAAQNDK